MRAHEDGTERKKMEINKKEGEREKEKEEKKKTNQTRRAGAAEEP